MQRPGDNLYTNCILALNPADGSMKWYFQFTPHDLHDWDSTEPPVLVDAKYRGADRKLLLHADRNGFFYVLDRTDGKFLLGTRFVEKLTWASGIGPDGRPQLLPANPSRRAPTAPSCGARFAGNLRALDIETGKIVWEVPQIGRGDTWSGVLTTAGNIVFYGTDSGAFAAVDARDGKPLWHFDASLRWKPSPVTFSRAGKQYVAISSGPNVLCFGLPD